MLAPLGLRDQFAAIDGRPWETPAGEERFAQAYATCALERRLPATISSSYYGFSLTPLQFAASCRLIRDAYRQWLEAPPPEPLAGQPPTATATRPGI